MLIISSAVVGTAVAQDAFAASALYGTKDRTKKMLPVILTSAVFTLFQMFMPVLGWSIGQAGSKTVSEFDHIIAFGILSFIGIKMMIDAKTGIGSDGKNPSFSVRSLILMAFATSIDALTIGITLPVITGADCFSKLMISVTVIGLITFIICFSGYILGRKLSSINPVTAQVIGGAVLVAIGIRTLLLS